MLDLTGLSEPERREIMARGEAKILAKASGPWLARNWQTSQRTVRRTIRRQICRVLMRQRRFLKRTLQTC